MSCIAGGYLSYFLYTESQVAEDGLAFLIASIIIAFALFILASFCLVYLLTSIKRHQTFGTSYINIQHQNNCFKGEFSTHSFFSKANSFLFDVTAYKYKRSNNKRIKVSIYTKENIEYIIKETTNNKFIVPFQIDLPALENVDHYILTVRSRSDEDSFIKKFRIQN